VKLLARAGSVFDRILNVLFYLVGVIFVCAMLIVCLDVVMRYSLNRPMVWATEVSEYILLGIVCLGIAWLLKEEGHVKIELVLARFKPRIQALINTITSSLAVLAVLAITWYGGQITWDLYQRGVELTKVLHVPKAPLLALLMVGMFLLLIQFLRRSYGYLMSWRALGKEQGP